MTRFPVFKRKNDRLNVIPTIMTQNTSTSHNTVTPKYFHVSCMYNAANALNYFKPNATAYAMIMIRNDGSFPTRADITNRVLELLKKSNPNSEVYEPFVVMSCTEWSKEQHDAFVSIK